MRGKIFFRSAVILLAICLSVPGYAATPEEVVARVQAQYDKTGGFKTRFRQESRVSAANQVDIAEGWMYFLKPSRMRWQYETPPEQKKELVSDGRQVWMYIPQDSLVMVYPIDKVLRSDLVMRFFSGGGEFQKDFQISWNRPPEGVGPFVVDCVPRKPQPELKRLTLTINPRTYLLDKLEFANAMGEETKFTFTQSQLNMNLKPDFFTFKPPPGVQVVKEGQGS